MTLNEIISGFELKQDIEVDADRLLRLHHLDDIAEHTKKVAHTARNLAGKFEVDETSAYVAGWLHDVGSIIPEKNRFEMLVSLGIPVLDEKRKAPSLLHQKVSRVIASEVFKIRDEDILNAVGHHTTMFPNASDLEMTVFLADKLSWNRAGNDSFAGDIIKGLETSLPRGVLAYLGYKFRHPEEMKVVHPWMLAAYIELSKSLNGNKAC